MEKIFSLWEVGDLLQRKSSAYSKYRASPRLVLGVTAVTGQHSSQYNGMNEDGILYESLDLDTGGVIQTYLHAWVWEKADGEL